MAYNAFLSSINIKNKLVDSDANQEGCLVPWKEPIYNHCMNITVVIPVFNEIQTIQEILQRVCAVGLATQIVIIDDGSTDGTREYIQSLPDPIFKVVLHEKNQGKGAAVVTGIQNADGEVIIIQDADLEYDPREYPNLVKPIEEGVAEVVYGSRFLGAGKQPVLFWNLVANKLLTLMTNILYSNMLTDMETGYKVFTQESIRGIQLHSKRFDFEPEFTAKVLKRHIKIHEVPISFFPRDYTQGKKIQLTDAFYAIWALIKYRFVD